MTCYNPDPDTIREEIFSLSENDNQGGFYLTNFYGKTLDGSDVAAYMESIGFEVVGFKDTGRCGLVTLKNGVQISTNGYAANCGLTTLKNGIQISTNGYAARGNSRWHVDIDVNGFVRPFEVMAETRHDAECKAINIAMREHGVLSEYKFTATYEV